LFFLCWANLTAVTPPPQPSEAAKPRRYKLGDIKVPDDPFSKSIEASNTPLVSLILTLGLAFFFRNGNVRFQTESTDLKINTSSR